MDTTLWIVVIIIVIIALLVLFSAPVRPRKAEVVISVPSSIITQRNGVFTKVTWNPVIGATGYTVYWGTQSGIYTSNLKVSETEAHLNLARCQTYYIAVKTDKEGCQSQYSEELVINTKLASPVFKSATRVGDIVTFDFAPVLGASRYIYKWGTQSAVYTQEYTFPTTSVPISVEGCSSLYVIAAATSGDSCTSSFSKEASYITTPPLRPTGLKLV